MLDFHGEGVNFVGGVRGYFKEFKDQRNEFVHFAGKSKNILWVILF